MCQATTPLQKQSIQNPAKPIIRAVSPTKDSIRQYQHPLEQSKLVSGEECLSYSLIFMNLPNNKYPL